MAAAARVVMLQVQAKYMCMRGAAMAVQSPTTSGSSSEPTRPSHSTCACTAACACAWAGHGDRGLQRSGPEAQPGVWQRCAAAWQSHEAFAAGDAAGQRRRERRQRGGGDPSRAAARDTKSAACRAAGRLRSEAQSSSGLQPPTAAPSLWRAQRRPASRARARAAAEGRPSAAPRVCPPPAAVDAHKIAFRVIGWRGGGPRKGGGGEGGGGWRRAGAPWTWRPTCTSCPALGSE